MTPADTMLIDSFLGKLLSTPRGAAVAVNMHDSFTAGLVSQPAIQAFLLDCAQTHAASPDDAAKIIQDVSRGYGLAKQLHLRQCKQTPSFSDTEQLSSSINTVSFHSFLLSDEYKGGSTGFPVVLPKVPNSSPSGLSDYQDRLNEIDSDPDWKKPAATIGMPLPTPSNCWLTSDRFGEDASAPQYPNDLATKARDELGLIDNEGGSYLLRLSFTATSIAKISGNELARPAFSDLGNSRFRASQSSARATTFAKEGWGATTHLGKLGNVGFSDSTGVCERVSSALPLDELENLSVEFLGEIANTSGVNAHDNDSAYENEVLGGRGAINIKNDLLSWL